jgi:hypothetical protein
MKKLVLIISIMVFLFMGRNAFALVTYYRHDPTPTSSHTHTPTPSHSHTPTPTPSLTPTPSVSVTPSETPIPSETPTSTPEPVREEVKPATGGVSLCHVQAVSRALHPTPTPTSTPVFNLPQETNSWNQIVKYWNTYRENWDVYWHSGCMVSYDVFKNMGWNIDHINLYLDPRLPQI